MCSLDSRLILTKTIKLFSFAPANLCSLNKSTAQTLQTVKWFPIPIGSLHCFLTADWLRGAGWNISDPRILRVRFFKKIQDWILKSERIWKRILRFFTRQINPRNLGSWGVNGTEESTSRVFDAPWSERSWIDLFSEKTQNSFSDSFGFKNPILDFLKETHP